MIVASMTTVPSRIAHIRPAIDSILSQSITIDHLEINIPYECVRTGERYAVPDWMAATRGLAIHRTRDYGSVTKIAPTLIRHASESDVFVWSCDDDFAYPRNQLELLWRRVPANGNKILTRHGGTVGSDGKLSFKYGEMPVTFFEGFGTVLYPPGCIGSDFLGYIERTSDYPDCRKSDDIVLSYYFALKGAPIFLCNSPSEEEPFYPTGGLAFSQDKDALMRQDGGHLARYGRALEYLRSNWPAPDGSGAL